jgi:HD-like signal output (HDOD) protein
LNLLRLFGSEDVSSRELANAIGDDAGLAAKILKVASSPMYGAGACENITRAIGIIGINRMKQMAVTLGYEQFTQEKSLVPAFDKNFFWEHCKATSHISRELMIQVNRTKQDNAYMAGLIHNVGFLAMERYAPRELNQAILIARTRKINILDAEMEACKFTHNDVSLELVTRWKLAPYIRNVVACLENPSTGTVDPEISCVLAVASTVAYEMGYPPIRGINASHTSEEYLPLINVSIDQMTDVVERARLALTDTKKAA